MRGRCLIVVACTVAPAIGSCARRNAIDEGIPTPLTLPVTVLPPPDAAPGPPVLPPLEPIAPVGWVKLAAGLSLAETQVMDDTGPSGWYVLRVDLAFVSPSVERVRHEIFEDATLAHDVLAAVNAGFFEPDAHPSGLVRSHGATLGMPRARGGSGVLLVRDHRASVRVATDVSGDDLLASEIAVQCGPRLVEADGTNGVHRDDGRRFARTAACVRDGGRVLDLVVSASVHDRLRGPGLFAFAHRLANRSPVGDPRGCESALNLDGGPSSGVYVRGRRTLGHQAIGPTPWALTLRERVGNH